MKPAPPRSMADSAARHTPSMSAWYKMRLVHREGGTGILRLSPENHGTGRLRDGFSDRLTLERHAKRAAPLSWQAVSIITS